MSLLSEALDRDRILDCSSSSGFVSCLCQITEIIITALGERKYPEFDKHINSTTARF